MLRLRKIALFLILILATLNLAANPKQIVAHGHSFSLLRSVVVVSTKADIQSANEIVKLLSDKGVSVKRSKRVGITTPRVILDHVKSIPTAKGKDGWQILVAANVVTIKYTTELSKQRAIAYLGRIIKDNTIQGFNITDWTGEVVKSKSGVIDAASKLVPVTQIESTARGDKSHEVYVQFVDANNWRLESEVFDIVNPKVKIYPKNGYYTTAQIASLISRMEKSRITIIPVIDLLTPNVQFERVTGHKMNSVEGMRFVRAIIEEYARKVGCKKLCVGTWADDADKRYVEFLNDIAGRCGVELIYK